MGIFDEIQSRIAGEYMNIVRSKKSFSQCGEDLILDHVFKLRGIEKPSYIDIGANDPFILNNTARFYKRGSRGINIEANPDLLSRFKKYRPNDVNLNIGISNEIGEMNFYIMKDHTLSTFSKEQSELMVSSGNELGEVKKIKLTTIGAVLSEHTNGNFPDFLSLDVEGLDFEILKSIDYIHSFPKAICVEASEYSPKGSGERRNDIIDFLVSRGYYEYANTNLNAILLKKEFWFS